jgi:transcription termination/antitermination protein NusG
MDKCWYAVLTRVGCEHRVATALRQQSRAQGHEEAFGEIIVPTEQVIALGADKKRRVKRRLFPGYLFVQMVLTKETWHLVHYTPKVVGFVGKSGTTPHRSLQRKSRRSCSGPKRGGLPLTQRRS